VIEVVKGCEKTNFITSIPHIIETTAEK